MAARKQKAAAKRPPTPRLTTVFDTNVVYSVGHDYVLNSDTSKLVSSKYDDVELTWVLPSAVRDERQFQMQKAARKLLPSVEKLERLTGRHSNIDTNVVDDSIAKRIDQELQDLGVSVHPLDSSLVDWDRLLADALYRRPPFDPEKEKGFRDALVLETFAQLVLQKTPLKGRDRLVLVTDDDLLYRAAIERTKVTSGIEVFRDLEQLRNLINILSSTVSEEFVNSYRPRAAAEFSKLQDHVMEQVAQLSNSRLPKGASTRKNRDFRIQEPTFVSKDQQRVTWSTRIEIDFEAFSARDDEAEDLSLDVNIRGLETPWVRPSTLRDAGLVVTTPILSPTVTGTTFSTGSLYNTSSLGFSSLTSPTSNWKRPYDYHTFGGTRSRGGWYVSMGIGTDIYEAIWGMTVSKDERVLNARADEVRPVALRWGQS